MVITKKQILKTMLLPGIIPRLKHFLGSGFSTLAYLIAVVYNTVRILPNNHPYLRHDMIGRYNIRQVIAEASNHITVGKKNIDQIIIFFSIIAALIILFIQFILLVIAAIIPIANAQVAMPTSIKEFFVTPNPKEDLAYRLLDLTFGIPDFFGSKEQVNTSLHQGLHALFEFYSYGIILVGAMIIVYFVVAVVAETAQSGTPFGQRFNKVWAPIRVILFFGLLIPISNGLNGGQYVTLASAKLGSSLASTGWVLFNEQIAENTEATLLGTKEQNVAIPQYSDLSHVPAFLLIAKTCQISYHTMYNGRDFPASWKPGTGETGIQAWAVYANKIDQESKDKQIKEAEDKVTAATDPPEKLAAEKALAALKTSLGQKYLSVKMDSTTFENLTVESKGSDIFIVFGVKDPNIYKMQDGGVAPICGKMILKVTDVSQPGAAVIRNAYYDLIKDMWAGTRDIQKFAENFTKKTLVVKNYTDPSAKEPTEKYIQEWQSYLKNFMEKKSAGIIAKAVQAQVDEGDWQVPKKIKDYGWAGAGIWYNKVAEQNGALISALRFTPATVQYPRVMELIKERKEEEDKNPVWDQIFTAAFKAGATEPGYMFPGEDQIANTLNMVFLFWTKSEHATVNEKTGNQVIDTINLLLGTGGLFELCKNVDIHPLAQLSAVGKSMVDSSIRAIGISGGLGFAGIFAGQFGPSFAAASGFFGTIASIGLLVGFILFYILPFLPFIYFFFAVGGWVKTIFEAMVAMPLWALAHLRIDGEGIPGDAAMGGYFLIFEIFIRPILIVIGLLASIAIFGAMVKILNEIFYLAISNLSGHDPKSGTACFQDPAPTAPTAGPDDGLRAPVAELKDAYRGPIDEFFFTILYTIVVYMIATSCFKLIDLIPNNILRWINAEVPSFSDNAGDGAEGLMKYVTLGGSQFGEQLGGSIKQMGGGVSSSIQQFIQK